MPAAHDICLDDRTIGHCRDDGKLEFTPCEGDMVCNDDGTVRCVASDDGGGNNGEIGGNNGAVGGNNGDVGGNNGAVGGNNGDAGTPGQPRGDNQPVLDSPDTGGDGAASGGCSTAPVSGRGSALAVSHTRTELSSATLAIRLPSRLTPRRRTTLL